MRHIKYRWIPKLSEDTIEFKGLDPACVNGAWECGDGDVGGIGLTKELAREQYEKNRRDDDFESTVGWLRI